MLTSTDFIFFINLIFKFLYFCSPPTDVETSTDKAKTALKQDPIHTILERQNNQIETPLLGKRTLMTIIKI